MSLEKVRRAVVVAEEADRLAELGRKQEAKDKFLVAADLLFEEAKKDARLKEPLDSILSRLEGLKAEMVWDSRVRVTRLFERGEEKERLAAAHQQQQQNPQETCFSESQPKGAGTFVTRGHASFGMVSCLMAALRRACVGDASDVRDEMTSAMLGKAEEGHVFEAVAGDHERFELMLRFPDVFRFLRKSVFHLPLLDSIGTRGMFELLSPGKSGSFLFFTSDMQFLIKTISSEEKDAFRPSDYYHHMAQNRDSLLNRVVMFASLTMERTGPLGMADIAKKVMEGESVLSPGTTFTVHFVVLENIIPPHRQPVELYDLKGSTLGRSAAKEQAKARDSGKIVILKDLDIQRKLSMTPEMRQLLLDMLARDTAWLQSQNVMDYSLLMAVCRDDIAATTSISVSGTTMSGDYCTCCGSERALRKPCPSCKLSVCVYCCDEARGLSPCHLCYGMEQCPFLGREASAGSSSSGSLPVAKRHASVFRSYDGGFAATDEKGVRMAEVYYLGVIDFLQPFNLRKTVEKTLKTVWVGGDEMQISVMEPPKYAARMLGFVSKLL